MTAVVTAGDRSGLAAARLAEHDLGPSLSAVSQAGLVNNLNDALAWGLLPIVWVSAGLDLAQIGLLAAVYPATWGVVQVATGALSDAVGRKRLIVAGMLIQAAAIAAIAAMTGVRAVARSPRIVLGLGTAMVYPTLIAVVADVAEPRQRGAQSRVSTASGATSGSRSGRSSSGCSRTASTRGSRSSWWPS